jgi:hypothetical protein
MINADHRQAELPLGINRFCKYPVIGRLCRFFVWWLVISGIYASSSACPFCGQLGCPVGAAGAGIVGGFLALVINRGKVFINHLTRAFFLISQKLKPNQDNNH